MLRGPFKLHRSAYFYADSPKFKDYVKGKHPEAVFVEEISLRLKNGGWSQNPGVVFYQENPPAPFTNKFFAYYNYGVPDLAARALNIEATSSWVITGLSNFDPIINAIFTPHEEGGTITISRFGHDYVTAPGGQTAIDGGRDYLRTLGNPTIVPYNMFTRTFRLNNQEYNVERQEW